MLFEQRNWKEDTPGSSTVKELQEILQTGKHITNRSSYQDARKKAEELENRLLRVRSLGGAFSEIEFSPDVQMLLNESSNKKHNNVLAL